MPSVSRIGGNLENVQPQLFALCLVPTVVTLKHRDEELGSSVDDLYKRAVEGIHGLLIQHR